LSEQLRLLSGLLLAEDLPVRRRGQGLAGRFGYLRAVIQGRCLKQSVNDPLVAHGRPVQ
jgi:hypothetical protein